MPDAPEAPQSIRDAIAEAVEGSEYVTQLEEGFDNLDELGAADATPDPGATDVDQTGDNPGAEGASGAADSGTEEEPPDSYWGTSLEDYSPEQRREIIAALEQRDSVIHKLQQQLAQEPPAPPEPTTADDEPELTDDDILRALDIDPEGDEYEIAVARKVGLPLAKQVMALEETVERLTQTEQTREISGHWNATLDKLEQDYGALPGDRVQVLQYAVREQITDPEVLYFRLTAPAKKAVEAEIAKVRQSAAKKVAQGGLRPSARQSGDRVISKDKTLRDTVREAALASQEESGFRWADVLRKR